MLFHVLNRGVGRMRLFLKDADFEAFERIIEQTLESCPMRVLADCLMSNHWHFDRRRKPGRQLRDGLEIFAR